MLILQSKTLCNTETETQTYIDMSEMTQTVIGHRQAA